MLSAGMKALTGAADARAAWSRFVNPNDVVGIKINASGAPQNLFQPGGRRRSRCKSCSVGVKPENIWVYERNKSQVDTVPYASFLPAGAHVVTADAYLGYDPFMYVETSFFGEDDTRSNLVRLVSEKLTKIINIPNMKDHGASGVTGCLKNIAYGDFSNVARSHQYADSNTLTYIATLCRNRAPAVANGTAHQRRTPRCLARRTVCPQQTIPVLSKADVLLNRPGRVGSSVARCY